LKGFIRNLFFNGFHPVVPWASFMLFGYWFGRQDLHNDNYVKKVFWRSGFIFVIIQVLSYLSIVILSEGNPESVRELREVLGTSPMPPLPFYMFNGIAIALTIISGCILVAKRFPASKIIDALMKTGQLALTFYMAHVIVGMGIVQSIDPTQMGKYSIEFSMSCAIIFSLTCILFAVIWRRYVNLGPLEWIMRKIVD